MTENYFSRTVAHLAGKGRWRFLVGVVVGELRMAKSNYTHPHLTQSI